MFWVFVVIMIIWACLVVLCGGFVLFCLFWALINWCSWLLVGIILVFVALVFAYFIIVLLGWIYACFNGLFELYYFVCFILLG